MLAKVNNSASERVKVVTLAPYTAAGPTLTARNPPSAGPMIEAEVKRRVARVDAARWSSWGT